MPELTPLEKLQPCLLDRLTDDDPKNPNESAAQRVISLRRYKDGVLRDLQWLFNAAAHLPDEGGERFRFADYPQALNSVINFGMRHLSGAFAPNLADLERELKEALQLFEPRIDKLRVKAAMERNLISIELHGDLWAKPLSEHLFIKTRIDLETGQCLMGDRGNGP